MGAKIFVTAPFTGLHRLRETLLPLSDKRDIHWVFPDEVPDASSIEQSIKHQITTADAVIADVSDFNPNVMYELGLAIGIGKQVLLLSQTSTAGSFALQAHQVIIYTHDEMESLQEYVEYWLEDTIPPLTAS